MANNTTCPLKRGDIVAYKGRNYPVRAVGQSKYAPYNWRVQLEFSDGSKTFWVDVSATGPATSSSSSRTPRERRYRCSDGNFNRDCVRPGCNCGGYDEQ